jgi:predicted acylesterase/phospholipase RssA
VGLTLIRKSQGVRPKREPVVALVLAGGAVSGGAFKVGGLKALNDFLVGRKITDFDMYVGLSAGAMLASALAAGVTPDEMVAVLEGSSARLRQLRPLDFYNPNWREFVERPSRFVYDLVTYLPGVAFDLAVSVPRLGEAVGEAARDFLRQRSYSNFERLVMRLMEHVSPKRRVPNLTNHLPTGFFDNSSLERWLRTNLERLRIPNDFREFERVRGRKLYVSACDLDTAERAIFGPDENADVTISEAVQASTALPIFYRPARLNGIDYVDGGVRHTANIDVAIEKGADLIICYNPFRPFMNRVDAADGGSTWVSEGGYLSDRGMKTIVNQVFRTLLHSRLKLGIQRYLADDRFQGDIVLLEPREFDAEFFDVNPIAFWKRSDAIEHGFESVRLTIEQNFDQLNEVLAHWGLEMNRGAARRKAQRARAARGWRGEEPPSSEDSPRLRLVGSRRA